MNAVMDFMFEDALKHCVCENTGLNGCSCLSYLPQGSAQLLCSKCAKVAEHLAEAGLHAKAVASALLHLYLHQPAVDL